MFTTNWYKAIGAVMSNKATTIISMDGSSRTAKREFAKEAIQLAYEPSASETGGNIVSIYNVLTATNGKGGVIFGDGSAEPTLSDTNLSGTMITTFTYSASVETNVYTNAAVVNATYTITNTADNPITIKEIGIVGNVSGTSTASTQKTLLERTLLENPITIPANGGVGQITYTLRMNYPVPTATE